ncbi:MAG: hypothetical protein KBA50_09310 [Sedimentibacter sp.]|jgi:uncharacterized coiled-coil protein SlyX|nr:hypothetical protein [Sedimentibacter sp.]
MRTNLTKSNLEMLINIDMKLIEGCQTEIQEKMKNLQTQYDKLSAIMEKYKEMQTLLTKDSPSVS